MKDYKDFSGKRVFIGLDVHKKKFAVSAICDGEQVGKISMNASHEGFLSYLLKHFPGAAITCAYEAGFSGFSLHRFLEMNKITCYVVHAASIEVSSMDRVKTDKRDSLKIAWQLAQGSLKSIRIPSLHEEQERSLSRAREHLCK